MAIISKRRFVLAFVLTTPLLALSACEIPSNGTGGSVYYDAMLWNDYYGRPGIHPLPPPGRPVHPIAPVPPRPPVVRPPVTRPPVARPPVVRPPIARPSRGRR